jgi:dihydrofolate synthase/folylpolyglutamate synthase
LQGLQRQSSLDEWLAWLETLHPKKIDLSLNRIRTVLEALELDEPPFKVVTVGGTNGKGSCVAYLSNIYRAARYRVGAFTSPHLVRFNERIEVDGEPATDQEIVDAFVAMQAALGRVTLSYFEASAVAAFVHFARSRVDVAVLEVGMGGRLDAVNVYDADAAIIASISLDHVEWLGGDRESIGFEKAGIMRAGRPVAIADRDPPRSLADAAAACGADALFIDRDFSVAERAQGLEITCRGGTKVHVPKPAFGGTEQHWNAAASVQTVVALRPVLPVADAEIAAGIARTKPGGRMDTRVLGGVTWMFDVAHNPAAAERLAVALAARPATHRAAVFGGMHDKDLRGVLRHFVGLVDHWHIATVDSERAATAAEIAAILGDLGAGTCDTHPDIAGACSAARSAAETGDLVVVFGSFYTVGPALTALGLYSPSPGSAL